VVEKVYKTLLNGRVGRFSGVVWPERGKWFEVEGVLMPCISGLHLCRAKDLLEWLAPEIWEAEYEGECIEEKDKLIVRKARLIRRLENWDLTAARLFELDCAEHFLWRYEEVHNEDKRPRKAIEIARRYIEGKAEEKELMRAVDEAWLAAKLFLSLNSGKSRYAARAAACAANDALDNDGIERRILNWSVFWDKATGTVGSKIWHAEREWQTSQLMKYLYPKEVRDEEKTRNRKKADNPEGGKCRVEL